MQERVRFEKELADLEAREYFWGFPWFAVSTKPATLGFEFDVHYGFVQAVLDDAGKAMPANGSVVTDHTEAVDFFRVKRDGPRMEISTKPFTVDDAGKKELATATANILKFAGELRKGCKGAALKDITVPDVSGKPRPFTHARTLTGGLPLVRLPFRKKFDPTECSVWASPQATTTVELSKVNALVNEIRATHGKGPGVALTGHDPRVHRTGVRSDALYKAQAAVNKMAREMIAAKPKLKAGAVEVNATTFTENLRGFLILLASYLWTGELTYKFADPDPPDYEPFAKAYLPLNVKAPFSAIRRELLTADERTIFDELFAKGAERQRMFRLVRPAATAATGATKLFPTGPKEFVGGTLDSVHEHQKAVFGKHLTWDDLIEHTLNPAHAGIGERLLVALSKEISLSNTKPRVAIEMRRIGFAAVFDNQWDGFMRRMFALTKKLN